MIHMEYYLIVSGYHVFRRYLRVLHPPQHTGDTYQHRVDTECHGYQLRSVQPFPFPDGMEGHFFALFSIAISAAETAVAIAIMINIYRNIRSIQLISWTN